MTGIDLTLVIVTISMLIAFGIGGRYRSSGWLWRWADVFYYPLGACGVVLLFFATDANRTLTRLTSEKSSLEADWVAHPDIRPQVAFDGGSTALLEARFAWFTVVREHGRVCAESTSLGCVVHARNGRIVDEVFGPYVPRPFEDEPIERVRKEAQYCSLGLIVVDRLQREAILSDLFGDVRRALDRVSRGAAEERLAGALSARAAAGREMVLSHVDPAIRDATEANLRAEGRFAVELFGNLAWCSQRNPGDTEALSAFDSWRARTAGRRARMAELNRRIERAQGGGAQGPVERLARSVQQRWWPFVLVLALAIKFGKATSAFPKQGVPWFVQVVAGFFKKLGSKIPFRGRTRRPSEPGGSQGTVS